MAFGGKRFSENGNSSIQLLKSKNKYSDCQILRVSMKLFCRATESQSELII